jgi:hypothetical protein
VQATITSYDQEDLKDDTLWEQFREDFAGWIEDDFKTSECSKHSSETAAKLPTKSRRMGLKRQQSDDR